MSDILNEIGQRVKETLDVVGKKADEMITIQGLKSQKRNAMRAINQEYIELGKMVYAKYQKGEALEEDAAARCEEINDQLSFIDQIDEEIINIQIKDDFEFDDDEEIVEDVVEEPIEEPSIEEAVEEPVEEVKVEEADA